MLTLTVQELLTGIVPPVRETLPEPAVAVTAPPQVLVNPLGVFTTRLAPLPFVGKLSVNATPWSATVLPAGLVMVMLIVLVPLG